MTEGYASILSWNLKHRFVTIASFALILYGSYWLYQNIEQEFQPPSPTRDVNIAAEVPSSYGIEEIKTLFANVEKQHLDKKDEYQVGHQDYKGSARDCRGHLETRSAAAHGRRFRRG
jgi:multidrug efflux pump subunit AcrB